MIYGVAAAETLGCLEDGGEGVSIPSIHHRNKFENSRNLLHIDAYFFFWIAPLTEISVDAHERMT